MNNQSETEDMAEPVALQFMAKTLQTSRMQGFYAWDLCSGLNYG